MQSEQVYMYMRVASSLETVPIARYCVLLGPEHS
jgi:hypothetical protein